MFAFSMGSRPEGLDPLEPPTGILVAFDLLGSRYNRIGVAAGAC
jgi:hypothetical protein